MDEKNELVCIKLLKIFSGGSRENVFKILQIIF